MAANVVPMDDTCFGHLVEACVAGKDPKSARDLVGIWQHDVFVLRTTTIPAIYCVKLLQALSEDNDVATGMSLPAPA